VRLKLVTVGLCVVLGPAGIVQTASADQSTRPTVVIRVRDTAQVPPSILMRALEEVTRIYRQAGVETRWPTSLSAEPKAVQTTALIIGIVSDHQVTRLPVLSPNSMGIVMLTANGRGRVGYVFYDRIHILTGPNRLHRALVLGVAIAHEIGHLLLPYHTHSQNGLMRAEWTTADLQRAQHGSLLFSAEEGELLRRHITASRPQAVACE
jgi:hypothetical protein